MVYVVLKSGKVLQYNSGEAISEDGNSYAIETVATGRGEAGLVARVPIANVERIEFGKPCAILRARKLTKTSRKY